MSERIWSAEDLVRFVQSEDAEVRFWAVERLVRHYPDQCCDRIADLVLDDHEATPGVVARHLGEHGGPQHHAVLVRGFRLLRGTTPAHCLRALVRLTYPNAVGLASDALRRGDLNEPVLGMIVEALAELDTPDAREQIREFLKRRPELWAEPAALGGILRTTTGDGLPEVLDELLRVLEWRGAHRAGEAFRTLMSALRVDDAAWCFRTGPSGHLELRKTIKAVESGYDCDILQAMGEPTIQPDRPATPRRVLRRGRALDRGMDRRGGVPPSGRAGLTTFPHAPRRRRERWLRTPRWASPSEPATSSSSGSSGSSCRPRLPWPEVSTWSSICSVPAGTSIDCSSSPRSRPRTCSTTCRPRSQPSVETIPRA